MSIARSRARLPVNRELLGNSFEVYHQRHVVPLIKAQDRAILILGAGLVVLAAAVIFLLVQRVG